MSENDDVGKIRPACPECGIQDFDVWDTDEFEDGYWRECICLQCDEQFTLVYQLIDVEVSE